MKFLIGTAAVAGVSLIVLGSPVTQRVAMENDGDAPNVTAPISAPITFASTTHEEIDAATLTDVIKTYCVICHTNAGLPDVKPPAGLSLAEFDVANATADPVTAERIIRKLSANMMPPRPMPRPGGDTLTILRETLERTMDNAAKKGPVAGARTFQRMNRPEYEAAIKDILGLEIDAAEWLPQDALDSNFDNVSEAQLLSPLVVESYLNAAGEISRMAIGSKNAPDAQRFYQQQDYVSQHPWDHVEGTPYGTRGGMVVKHVFPADAFYVLSMEFRGQTGNQGLTEDIDISIDGERVALLHQQASLQTEPLFIRAGQHEVSVAFVREMEGPYEDLLRPHEWALAGGTGGTNSVTHLPYLRAMTVLGPKNATGVSDFPARQSIFVCRPTTAADELPCASKIVQSFGTRAYRRPLTQAEVDGVLNFYKSGAQTGGFEEGVRAAVEAILAHPNFYFRIEQAPTNARANRDFEVSDRDLAVRLAFFIWGTPPDQELLDLASRNKLSDEKVLEQQTRRMIADPRASALGERFAAQWFRLQDLYKMRPDPNFFTAYDENLADAMKTETEMFFVNLVKEDRPFTELLTADYTFVNERLARHYGLPNVAGTEFRKVQYPDDHRVGILGQGSVLVLTSLANRTSPVLRGKWVMEVLLGTPPPPPPPGVPALTETKDNSAGKILTTRERMEIHRANAMCQSCHRLMDPIGLSLDNFDITAKYRYRENGMPLDTRGELYDGTPVTNPKELVNALMARPIPLARNFTVNLLTYAIGRRLTPSDQPAVRTIQREAEANGYRMSSFILGVVKSDQFQMRTARATTSSSSNEN
jgi:hypothetical protein